MKRILIVEDDELLRELYVERLREEFQVEIFTASTGNQGIAAIDQNPHLDLIISDINMPDGNGMDVLLHLINSELNIPLVFFSSNLDSKIRPDYEKYLGLIDKSYLNKLCELVNRQIQL